MKQRIATCGKHIANTHWKALYNFPLLTWPDISQTASIAEELSAQADLLRDLVAQISRIVGTKIVSSTVTAASSIGQLDESLSQALASQGPPSNRPQNRNLIPMRENTL